MSTAYEFQEANGLTIDTLTDEAAGIRLQVNRKGAEPISLARRNLDGTWTGFLWRDADTSNPAEGWKNHSTVMGFYVHRIKDEVTTYRGHSIRGGTHSFLRHKDFAPPAVNGSMTYTIGPAEIAPEEYPFKVRMNLTYALVMAGDDPELAVTFEFQNLEPGQSVHLSFGLHPGFAVTSLADARILLPAGKYIRHLAPGNFLSGETVTIDHPGGPMPFDKAALPDSFILELAGVPDPIFTVEDPAGHRRVNLDFCEAPYLTLWSDGHNFICVEPCWGLPDSQIQNPFEQKPGIQEIPPGQSLTRTFSIRPQLMV